MRNPLLWLVVMIAGVGMFFHGGANLPATDPLAMPFVMGGCALFALGLIMLVISWRASRRNAFSAALASTDSVARWQVHGADMEVFRQVDAARAGRLWSLSNSLSLPAAVPMEGFPVVIGEHSLLVGERLYDLGIKHFGTIGEVSLHHGQPGFLEISTFLPGEQRKTHIVVLRIPVPAAARAEAETALAWLDAQIQPADRAHIRRWFGAHFEAADQAGDAPHRLQRRRKWLLPLLAAIGLAMLAFVFVPRLM